MTKRRRQRTWIREHRIAKGLTQEQLGRVIGKTAAQISELERGAQRYNQDLLEQIGDALGATPGELLTVNPLKAPPPQSALYDLVDKLPARSLSIARRILEALVAESDS